MYAWPFSAPFPILGANFSARGSLLSILMVFCVFEPNFWWIFMICCLCFLRTRLHFLRQDSAMNRQGSARKRQDSDQQPDCIFWVKILPWIAKVLAETAKILMNFFTYTSTLVECGGLRLGEQNTNCIRAAPLLSEY